ncbi:MAG: helix-turn-helix transcriptional regulator [Candidatus Sericytochromatia bacterium]
METKKSIESLKFKELSTGEIITLFRESMNLSKINLAEKLLFTEEFINRLENDQSKPTKEICNQISKVLNIPDRILEIKLREEKLTKKFNLLESKREEVLNKLNKLWQ